MLWKYEDNFRNAGHWSVWRAHGIRFIAEMTVNAIAWGIFTGGVVFGALSVAKIFRVL